MRALAVRRAVRMALDGLAEIPPDVTGPTYVGLVRDLVARMASGERAPARARLQVVRAAMDQRPEVTSQLWAIVDDPPPPAPRRALRP